MLGTEGNQPSERPSLSQGGRFVAFESTATNLVGGDTNSAPGLNVLVDDLSISGGVA